MGFKRIKALLRIALFFVVSVGFYSRYTENPVESIRKVYPSSDHKQVGFRDRQIVKTKWFVDLSGFNPKWSNEFEFPIDMTEKQIRYEIKKLRGYTFWPQFETAALNFFGGLIALELCFWIPFYIFKGFSRPKD